jgi:hypothetical protein
MLVSLPYSQLSSGSMSLALQTMTTSDTTSIKLAMVTGAGSKAYKALSKTTRQYWSRGERSG